MEQGQGSHTGHLLKRGERRDVALTRRCQDGPEPSRALSNSVIFRRAEGQGDDSGREDFPRRAGHVLRRRKKRCGGNAEEVSMRTHTDT